MWPQKEKAPHGHNTRWWIVLPIIVVVVVGALIWALPTLIPSPAQKTFAWFNTRSERVRRSRTLGQRESLTQDLSFEATTIVQVSTAARKT